MPPYSLVGDGDLGIGSTLGVDRGGNTIGAAADGAPCDGRGTSRGLQVDSREDGRARGEGRRTGNAVHLQSLGGPDELSGASGGEGCTGDVGERRDVVVAGAAAAGKCDDTVECGAGRGPYGGLNRSKLRIHGIGQAFKERRTV